jgi:hypothetical protein
MKRRRTSGQLGCQVGDHGHLASGPPNPKKNGKMRPLGLPSWTDKLVGEVVRLLLEPNGSPDARRGQAAHPRSQPARRFGMTGPHHPAPILPAQA